VSLASDIAIATVTLCRDAAEEARLREALVALTDLGLPVAVSDGGSGEAFTTLLANLAGVMTAEPLGPHLVGQVQASLSRARQCGARSILYVESDKRTFFEKELTPFLQGAASCDDAAIVVAGRSAGSFETFPPLQRLTEQAINALCGEMIGVQGDYSYGPFLMARELADRIASVPAEIGWGWRPFLFVTAHLEGRRVAHVTRDFCCPDDQRDESPSEKLHRLRQLAQNVNGVTLALTIDPAVHAP